MFRLASTSFAGQRVFIVEHERCTADLIAHAVLAGGGTVVAEATDVFRAMAVLRSANRVNCVVIDVALAVAFPEPIVPLLAGMGIAVIFVVFDEDLLCDQD
jgi:CheY-like chemotaxis protein